VSTYVDVKFHLGNLSCKAYKSRYPTKSFVGEVIDIVGTQTKVGVGVHLVNLFCKKIDRSCR